MFSMLVKSVIIFYLLIFIIKAYDIEFIRDYFTHKNIKRIVGFSCGNITGNFINLFLLSYS